jgi:hypothetical protein
MEVSGVLRSEADAVHLDTISGQDYSLQLGAETSMFYGLSGNSVALVGPRIGHRIWVRKWRVVTGADGSIPYLGRVERHGANLILLDRNTGRRFTFDASSLEKLDGAVGSQIILQGFAVEPHVLHVVDWKILDQPQP